MKEPGVMMKGLIVPSRNARASSSGPNKTPRLARSKGWMDWQCQNGLQPPQHLTSFERIRSSQEGNFGHSGATDAVIALSLSAN